VGIVMTEEQLGKLWRERAWDEGHRPGLPPIASELTGICQPNRGRMRTLSKFDEELIEAIRQPKVILDLMKEFKFHTENEIRNCLRRLNTHGYVEKRTVVKYGRAMLLWWSTK
jgi:hypothetical protein